MTSGEIDSVSFRKMSEWISLQSAHLLFSLAIFTKYLGIHEMI
jgi:hypothetical protein